MPFHLHLSSEVLSSFAIHSQHGCFSVELDVQLFDCKFRIVAFRHAAANNGMFPFTGCSRLGMKYSGEQTCHVLILEVCVEDDCSQNQPRGTFEKFQYSPRETHVKSTASPRSRSYLRFVDRHCWTDHRLMAMKIFGLHRRSRRLCEETDAEEAAIAVMLSENSFLSYLDWSAQFAICQNARAGRKIWRISVWLSRCLRVEILSTFLYKTF
jgi:hypothetical protein